MSTNYPNTLKLSITAADIHDGIQGSCSNCPIALSAHRQFPDAAGIKVGKFITFYDGNWIPLAEYKCSTRAVKFIKHFDEGNAMKPVIFKLVKSSAYTTDAE